MIPYEYRPAVRTPEDDHGPSPTDREDIQELKKYLKSLGYTYFLVGNYEASAQNLKRGIKVIFYFDPSLGRNSLSRLQSVEILCRKRFTKWNKEVRTEYAVLCKFDRSHVFDGVLKSAWSVKISEKSGVLLHEAQRLSLIADEGLSWDVVTKIVDRVLQNVEGDPPIPKSKVDGILQNIILADLKAKLIEAGYSQVKFSCKAKVVDGLSSLVIRANHGYKDIVLSLKSGKMLIFFGQDNCAVRRDIPCPSFEDPRFNPDLLKDAVIASIEKIKELQKSWVAFELERTAVYNDVERNFKNLWK